MTALPHYGADPDILRLCTLLRSVLQRETFTTMADLKEACACAIADLSRKNPKYPFHYDGWQLDRAFEIVGATRPLLQVPPRPTRETPPPGPPPYSHREAQGLLAAWKVELRGMPETREDPGHAARLQAQREAAWQVRPPRRSLRERLEGIFNRTED